MLLMERSFNSRLLSLVYALIAPKVNDLAKSADFYRVETVLLLGSFPL